MIRRPEVEVISWIQGELEKTCWYLLCFLNFCYYKSKKIGRKIVKLGCKVINLRSLTRKYSDTREKKKIATGNGSQPSLGI